MIRAKEANELINEHETLGRMMTNTNRRDSVATHEPINQKTKGPK